MLKNRQHFVFLVTILKDCVDVYLVHLTYSVNHSLQTSIFPQKLKQLEVIPWYKKLDPLNKENYRPVSLLYHISKVFERIIYKQINSYMEDKLRKCLTGFIKSHGTQHSLLTMLENVKEELKMERVSLLYLWSFQRPLIYQL